jgi:hypothetical protein
MLTPASRVTSIAGRWPPAWSHSLSATPPLSDRSLRSVLLLFSLSSHVSRCVSCVALTHQRGAHIRRHAQAGRRHGPDGVGTRAHPSAQGPGRTLQGAQSSAASYLPVRMPPCPSFIILIFYSYYSFLLNLSAIAERRTRSWVRPSWRVCR